MDKELLKQTGLVDNIDDKTVDKICANLQHIAYHKGDVIIHEGEIGDALYIIESGAVRVFTIDENNQEVVLARLESGNYFGEQALLDETPRPRNASVKALSDVSLLKITANDLRVILNMNKELYRCLQTIGKQQLLEKLSSQLSALGKIKETLFTLAEAETIQFSDQEVIFREADTPDYVYFILEGEALIRIHGDVSVKAVDIRLGAGHIFGELGVLENKPRNGTAIAVGNLRVLRITAEKFQQVYDQNSELKKLVAALYKIYQIPNRGVVTQYHGKFLDMDAINSIFKLENGETVLASHVIETKIFSITNTSAKNPRKLRFEYGESIWREAFIEDGKLVGVTNFGQWDDLGSVSAMVLDKTPIDAQREKAFIETGMFVGAGLQAQILTDDRSQIICDCMSVPKAIIQNAIESGATQVEQVSNKTGAGTVCGSCRQKIADLLGRAAWFPASISIHKEHNKDIRSFQLTPINCQFKVPKPGQYILIQVEINRNWIERAYTLTSLPQNSVYEIMVKREPLGLFSQWLFQKNEIALARVSSPMGKFVLNPDAENPIVCFAGGIGITPILTFIRHMAAINKHRRLHVEYSASQANEFVCAEELKKIAKQYTTITINFRTSQAVGRMNKEDVMQVLKGFDRPEVYVCGPVGFEKTVVEGATAVNINLQNIHIEQFIHAGGPVER